MPKIVDHDQYRKELLSKSSDLFAQKGYASVTMRQIAESLGVSTGTLYHYFPSKENLFEQLIDYISYQDTAEQTIAELGKPPTLPERVAAISEFISKNEEYFLHQTFMLVDFCRQQSRSQINQNQTIGQAGKRYEQAIQNCLELEDSTIATFIANFVDGLLLRRLYLGDRISISEQLALLGQMLTSHLEQQIK